MSIEFLNDINNVNILYIIRRKIDGMVIDRGRGGRGGIIDKTKPGAKRRGGSAIFY